MDVIDFNFFYASVIGELFAEIEAKSNNGSIQWQHCTKTLTRFSR